MDDSRTPGSFAGRRAFLWRLGSILPQRSPGLGLHSVSANRARGSTRLHHPGPNALLVELVATGQRGGILDVVWCHFPQADGTQGNVLGLLVFLLRDGLVDDLVDDLVA